MLNFNSFLNKVQLEFGEEAPDFRKVSQGLTLFAICQTEQCEAFNKQVCIQKGFGKFNIAEERRNCKCPSCGNLTQQSRNLGYFQTFIIFKGIQQDGKPFHRQDTAQKEKFITFDENDRQVRTWKSLEIETKPLP